MTNHVRPTAELGDLVRRAQAGDTAAFEQVVDRCRDMALAYAFGQLGNAADAPDVAQEAFIDAYRKLALLREPAAFPGWLRSIVATRAQRLRRGRDRDPRLEPAAETDPEQRLLERERRDRLWSLVESLPPHERVVIAMHHLAGNTYAEVADVLGVSEESARTRAHRARRRLRDQLEDIMEQDLATTWAATRPQPQQFTTTTVLFAAIETGDLATVRRLLDQYPDLANSEERWDDTTARRAGLQPARHASPLIRAVGRDRADLVGLLIERGAEVNRTCGCAGGETALWAAAVAGSHELVRLLLDHGADPGTPAFAGTTPLHAATIRGHDDIVSLLLAAGARADAVDDHGRTADDWVVGDDTSSDPTMRVSDRSLLATGIRSRDLFAPLRRGGLVEWLAPAGTGSLVLLIEVLHRLTRLEGLDAEAIGFEHAGLTERELRHGIAELAPATRTALRLATRGGDASQRRESFDAAVTGVTGVARPHGAAPVIVVAQHPAHRTDVEAAMPRLLEVSSLVILIGDDPEASPATTLPVTTRVVLDEVRARAGLYPALDPVRSSGEADEATHARLAAAASELLARYAAIDPELRLEPVDATWVQAAQRLHRYLAQPFLTTEPFTGRPGESTARTDLLRDVGAILTSATSEPRRRPCWRSPRPR